MINIVLVDHNDSFTNNIVDWLLAVPEIKDIRIINFEDQHQMSALANNTTLDLLILSPGPHAPQDAQPTIKLTKNIMFKIPLLGICLGHQIIGFTLGFAIEPLQEPQHGRKKAVVINDFYGLYHNIEPGSFSVGVYNSLCITGGKNRPLNSEWVISGHDASGQILSMEFRHAQLAPVMTMQFHPDSFLTTQREVLANNVFNIVDSWRKTNPRIHNTTTRRHQKSR